MGSETNRGGMGGTTEQADLELDPRRARDGINQSPANMGIDPVRLFEQATEQTRMALCVSDPHQKDCPIVFANQAFTSVTGYPRSEIVGRNCRFLQGRDTDPEAVERIRRALREETVTVTEILNYRRDGTPFWNSLHVGPIYDEAGTLTHFYGSQWDVTELIEEREKTILGEQVAEELQHRTRNLFGVLTAIVRLSAQGMTDAQALADKIEGRIEALSRAHEASIAPGGRLGRAADLRTLADSILQPYRTGAVGRIEIDGPAAELPAPLVTPVGLALHELATNALKYGALREAEGGVALRWKREGDELLAVWREEGGRVQTERVARVDGTGSRLVDGVIMGVGGGIARDWRPEGLAVTLRLPLA